ncbi:MAG TPA: hypothetical protein VJV23_02895 [Candidatus Polarisedimenticolia bacterium]|nr:hypothetical protein [Candidatus Polarisedimenticolia bacterium]
MAAPFAFGDLVLLPADAAAGAAQAGGLWMVAELRRSDCRVLQPMSGRSQWVPLRGLRAARPEEAWGTVEMLIAELLALLGATALEVTALPGETIRLAATCGMLRPEALDQVRERLGPRLGHLVIRPAGLHRLQAVMEFSTA